jgi:death-on-curing protein
MISVELAVSAHEILIDEFGGSKGVRDINLLESALNRPYATFDGIDLYPSAIEKATALFESLIINHPFMDGNKRIAYLLTEVILREDGLLLDVSQSEKYKLVISASIGEFRFDEIKAWIETKVKTISQ